MDSASAEITAKIQGLGDLELAVIVCLITDQHCIIRTEKNLEHALDQELRLVSNQVFGLSYAVLDCSENTTLDEFVNGVLVDDPKGPQGYAPEQLGEDYYLPSKKRDHPGAHEKRSTPNVDHGSDGRGIANVVIAKNLNAADHQVQIQALELIRNRSVTTRRSVYEAPKHFLFIALLSSEPEARLTVHLNDHFSISHIHATEDGLPNLEQHMSNRTTGDNASLSSILHNLPEAGGPLAYCRPSKEPFVSAEDTEALKSAAATVRVSPEVRAYLHNIVVFMRMHRAVAGGISAIATRHFHQLVKALAPLHNLSYVPPSLVALATRKVYPHRILITTPENERSMQWGSDIRAVREMLDGMTVEDIIENVLTQVEVPL